MLRTEYIYISIRLRIPRLGPAGITFAPDHTGCHRVTACTCLLLN